jgi:hypothetical protein
MTKIGRNMKLLFCGDRAWKDAGFILQVMSALKVNLGDFTVIEGEAKGADSLSRTAALLLELPVEKYPADWAAYGKAAGPIRNKLMLVQGKPTAVFAFHNDLEHSKGTKNMVEMATKANLPVWVSSDGPDDLAKIIIRLKKHVRVRSVTIQ